LISQPGSYLCRQRPTLPHTFACSNIGPAGLNFRVRDGNGWIPRGKITDKAKQLLAIGSWPLAVSCRLRSSDSTQLHNCCKLIKDREDNASQLNRLDSKYRVLCTEYRANFYFGEFLRRSSRQLLLLSHSGSNDIQTTFAELQFRF
jgi:hypothetical protein